MNTGCAGKTVRSPENAWCHTWVPYSCVRNKVLYKSTFTLNYLLKLEIIIDCLQILLMGTCPLHGWRLLLFAFTDSWFDKACLGGFAKHGSQLVQLWFSRGCAWWIRLKSGCYIVGLVKVVWLATQADRRVFSLLLLTVPWVQIPQWSSVLTLCMLWNVVAYVIYFRYDFYRW